ncbi:MAG: tetratricopeptide repeat protein, partial [Phycisphaerae bacterium]|nr:tetratricopeptide repeat protein [Phycisphaerae bacterium]
SWHDDTLCQLATAAMKEAKVAIAEAERQLRAARRRPLPQVKKDESAKRKAKADKTKKKNARRGRRGKGNRGKKGKTKPKTKPKKPAKPKSPTELLAEREKVKAAQLPIWSKALKYWQELVERYPASRHVQAARYNIGVIYFEVAQAKKGAEALEKLVADHPKGVYTGESLLLLGRYALEYVVDPVLARKYFTNLDKWADETRESALAKIATDTPKDPAEVAKKKDQEPLKEGETRRVSFGSKPKKERQTFDFQMLEKCHACNWYLNGLQAQCAKFLGFLHFVDGEKEKALAQYDRLRDLDPEVGRTRCNDLNRLRWGAEHGYMYAFPQELKPFKGRQRLGVMLADFYFFTLQFDKSAVMAKRMLKGELGSLHGVAREYPQFLYAECVYWTAGREAAVPEFVKVFGGFKTIRGNALSYTKERAAYAAANIATQSMQSPKLRKMGLAFMKQLAFSGRESEHSYKARVSYAILMYNDGKLKEAIRILETVPAEAGEWKTIANMYLNPFKKNLEGRKRKEL